MILQTIKDIIIENKQEKEISQTLESYKQKAYQKGAVLFAVCRGRLVEGIDFSDGLARGVLLAGIPNLPPSTYVNMKFQFLENTFSKLTGTEWFQQQTIRNINQAIGRVIRHKNDYGCILMFDIRFNKYKGEYPRWIGEFQESHNFEKFLKDLKIFFDRQLTKFEENNEKPIQKQAESIEQMVFPDLNQDYRSNDDQNFEFEYYQNFEQKQTQNRAWDKQIFQPNQKKVISTKTFEDIQEFPGLTSSNSDFPEFQTTSTNLGILEKIQEKPKKLPDHQIYPQQQNDQDIDKQIIGKKKKKGKNLVYITGGFQ